MKSTRLIALILSAIGIVCLLSALYLAVEEIRFKSNSIPWKAVVADFRGLTFAYEYPAGTRHTRNTHASSSGWNWMDGDALDIEIDKRNPDHAQVKGFVDQWFAFSIMALFGMIFGGIGFGMIGYRRRQGKRKEYLLNRGVKIQARISSIDMDESIRVNGRSPFIVHAEAMIDGKMHLFDSEYLWYDPEPHLTSTEVVVYYDADNARSYYMDVSMLPKISE